MSAYGTQFVESEAILAAQADDRNELDRILADMLPGELQTLARAAHLLAVEAAQTASAKIRINRKKSA